MSITPEKALRTARTLGQQVQHSLVCRAVAVLIGCSSVWGVTSAHADQAVVDEVSGLLEQGRLDQAAQRAEAHLRGNPGDVQVRFLQGVIATEQGSNAKAIDIFTALARDFPQLPEPFNNLAVLYAAQGDERKAAQVLESAIRTNPSYATAHENLGDLYARMASEAYAKALQLDESRQALQPKLSLITQIFPGQDSAPQTVAQNQVVQPSANDRAAQQARKVAQVEQEQARLEQQALAQEQEQAAKVAAQAAAKEQAAQEQQARLEAEQQAAREKEEQAAIAAIAAQQAAVEKAEAEKLAAEKVAAQQQLAEEKKAAEKQQAADAKAAEKAASDKLAAERAAAARAAKDTVVQSTEPAEAPKASTVEAELNAAVQEWADAWASQNMDRYFDAYSKQFKPADGSTLAQWKEQRTQRIVGRPTISVLVRNLKVSAMAQDSATVQFRQTYASGAFKASTQKTLRLQKEGGQWRIVHEGTGG